VQNAKKISVIGLVTFIVFGSCIGTLVQAAAEANRIATDTGYILASGATFIAAWYSSRTWLDEGSAVAIAKLFWYTYFPVGMVCWFSLTDGTEGSMVRFCTVGALSAGILFGSDTKASCDAEASHLTIALSFIAIACQFTLVQWPINDVPRLLIVASLALFVSLVGAFQYGRPRRPSGYQAPATA